MCNLLNQEIRIYSLGDLSSRLPESDLVDRNIPRGSPICLYYNGYHYDAALDLADALVRTKVH